MHLPGSLVRSRELRWGWASPWLKAALGIIVGRTVVDEEPAHVVLFHDGSVQQVPEWCLKRVDTQ